jgi:hypothetical protein
MAQYDDVGSLLAAAEVVRDAGFKKWDCHSPFPVHGLDRAMGVRRTILPWLVLGGGLTGMCIAIFLQFYVNNPAVTSGKLGAFSGYPLVFSGKPFWGLPANVPIIFELTVLLSALTAFFGLWVLTGLPRLYYPAFSMPRFRRATDDKFFVIIEARDEKFDARRTHELLESTHAAAIEEVKD